MIVIYFTYILFDFCASNPVAPLHTFNPNWDNRTLLDFSTDSFLFNLLSIKSV